MLTANMWLGWPLNSVVATGALQSIPSDLYEAAEMDGAGCWQKFKTITLPYLRPAMLPYAIYGFVITFNLFYLRTSCREVVRSGGPSCWSRQAYRLVERAAALRRRRRVRRLPVLHPAGVTLVTNRLAKATKS